MATTRWSGASYFAACLSLAAMLAVAGGMSGGNCTSVNPFPNNGGGTTGGTNTTPPPAPVPSEPAATQPDSGGAANTPPSLTFQWPTAPVSIQNGTVVAIQWTVKDPEDNAKVSIFARDSFGADSVLASGMEGTKPVSTGAVNWNTSVFPNGDYKIVAQVYDGKNAPVTVTAPGVVTILPRPPGGNNPPGGGPPPAPVPNQSPIINFSQPTFDVTITIGTIQQIKVTASDNEVLGVNLIVFADPDATTGNGNDILLLNQFFPATGGTTSISRTIDWDTTGLAVGAYRVVGIVDDLFMAPATPHKVTKEAGGKVTIIPAGTGTVNLPPTLTVVLPDRQRGITDGEFVGVGMRYTNKERADTLTMTLALDKDTNPNNDDPSNPNDTGVIMVQQRQVTSADPINNTVAETDTDGDGLPDTYIPQELIPAYVNGAVQFGFDLDQDTFLDFVGAFMFMWKVDTSRVPVRNDVDAFGNPLPYNLKVVLDDGHTKVTSYAIGKIFVQARAGQGQLVDCKKVGGTVAGATFRGFKQNDYLGSSFASMGSPLDFQRFPGDPTPPIADEFVIAARFGTPRNRGNVGTAYYFLGQPSRPDLGRYGGTVTMTASAGPQTFGIAFGADKPLGLTQPPPTLQDPGHPTAKTSGIMSICTVPDMNGDGVLELAMSIPFVSGVYNAVDVDPQDCSGIPPCNPPCAYTDQFPALFTDGPNCASDDLGAIDRLGIPIDGSQVYIADGNGGTGYLGQLAALGTGGQAFVDLRYVGTTRGQIAGAGLLDDEGVQIPLITPRTDGVNFRGAWFGPNVNPVNGPIDPTNEFGRTICAIQGLHSRPTPDFVVSSPGWNQGQGRVWIFIGQDWMSGVESSDNAMSPLMGNMSIPQMTTAIGICAPFCAPARLTTYPQLVTITGNIIGDRFGQALPGGDYNNDGVPDLIAGSPGASAGSTFNAGRVFLIYNQQNGYGSINLATDAGDDPDQGTPRLELWGTHPNDKFGQVQTEIGDFNGDGVSDVAIASPDFDDTRTATPSQDAGFVGVLFAKPQQNNSTITGPVSKIGTSEVPGIIFIGATAGSRAGTTVSGAGDFDGDGFADLLICAPNEERDVNTSTGIENRKGVTYLIYGSPTLANSMPVGGYSLSQVGSPQLPGIVFVSPFIKGSIDEAPLETVGALGDIDADGFADIIFGAPQADKFDPANPGQRQSSVGQAYLIYGSKQNRP